MVSDLSFSRFANLFGKIQIQRCILLLPTWGCFLRLHTPPFRGIHSFFQNLVFVIFIPVLDLNFQLSEFKYSYILSQWHYIRIPPLICGHYIPWPSICFASVFQCNPNKFIQAVVELRLSGIMVVWQDMAINTSL